MPNQEQIKLILMMAARDFFSDPTLSDKDASDYRTVEGRIRLFTEASWAEEKYGAEKMREAKAWIALHDALVLGRAPIRLLVLV